MRTAVVMSFEEGRIFRNPAFPETAREDQAEYYDAIVRAMATLHDIDVDTVGLSDYGRGGNYFEREINLWTRQYRASETSRIDTMETLIEWLLIHCPADDGTRSLVHGDFQIDNNLIFDSEQCRIKAMLDWELSTLGNPLADLAYFCMCLRLPANGPVAGLHGMNRAAARYPGREGHRGAVLRAACHSCDLRLVLLSGR